jgi:hypothetical protein
MSVVPYGNFVGWAVVVVLDLLLSHLSTAEIVGCMTIGLVDCSRPAIFAVDLVWSVEEVNCTWLMLVRSRSRLGTSTSVWVWTLLYGAAPDTRPHCATFRSRMPNMLKMLNEQTKNRPPEEDFSGDNTAFHRKHSPVHILILHMTSWFCEFYEHSNEVSGSTRRRVLLD